jgi:glutaredoxin-like YruB-family protein
MILRTSLAIITLLSSISLAGAETHAANQQQASATSAVAQPGRFTGTVELYVTDWCGYCKKARKYLTDQNIPFVAYDIEKDSAANQRHKALGGNGVPLIIIGKHKMSGFSQEAMEYYLNNGN